MVRLLGLLNSLPSSFGRADRLQIARLVAHLLSFEQEAGKRLRQRASSPRRESHKCGLDEEMRVIRILFNFVEDVAEAVLLELELADFRTARPHLHKRSAQRLHADKADCIEAGERVLHLAE